MTENLNSAEFTEHDAAAFRQVADEATSWLEQAQEGEEVQRQREEALAAEDQRLTAEQNDPRNRENWGAAGVVKELQSAFLGGVQDTASSIATLPERGLDILTGEMQEEMKSDEGYDAEWDNWFVDDKNPIETKTWWGGLIRSATHFGTMGVAIVKAAPAIGAGATAVGAGRAVQVVGGLVSNQWARAAAVGAASDLASKYSQDANGLQVLRDRYGFIDTPLTTNDMDHPVVKTFKNVAEGIGIGEVANGLFRVMGKGMKRVLPDGRVADASELAVQKGVARTQSVDDQTLEAAQLELFEVGPNKYAPNKNKPVSNIEQAAHTSLENPYDARQSLKRIRNELGAEDGSVGSLTTPVQMKRIRQTSGFTDEMVTKIFRDLVSEPRFQAEMGVIREGNKTMMEVWGDAVEQFQRTGLGREAAEQSAAEYLAEYYEGAHRYFADTPDEMIAWTSKNVVAGDLLIGSLMREIRDLGIAGREMFDVVDLGSQDGPAQALFEKLLAVTTEVNRSRLLQSTEFRNLGAGRFEAIEGATPQKEWFENTLKQRVDESIDAYRLALKVASESDNDDLFKAIFESVSMTKGIENIKDFDNWVRTKLRGGDFEGKPNTNLLIREWERVMVNSILSGPKTPVRAIMGTGSATFLRPLSTAAGAFFNGDGATLRASLAASNAMRQSIPDAWKLFKSRLNSYWAGDVATIKSRYTEFTKGDQHWDVFRHWVENSGRATDGDKAAFYMANMARGLNDNKFLTYSTKIMAATDDTFGYILGRSKAREKAMREAMDMLNDGKITEITPELLKNAEDRLYGEILDADGNIRLDTDLGKNVEWAKKEATLTTDLTGFSKGLNDVFNATPWAKPFFLFARTGVNGLALTAKHTPGFNFLVKEFNDIARANIDDLSNVAKYGINNAEDLMNAKALQNGRLIIGGSVISMAGLHFMNGGLTGNGPTDRQMRQVWLDAGWVPRSINIGGVWVGYDSFEPFNQILSAVADIGDHSQLMGEEWTKDQFQKLSMVVMQAATSKSYLQGLQGLVDMLAGEPGQHERIIAGLMNNTIPLAGLRNEIGKLFTPHMKELNKGWQDTFRNRNLIFENIASEPLPVKYDMLNGAPIREYDFVTRMWNAVIPVSLNLDQGPGRKLLFDSGYDLRLSTYYGPDGTDLTESPRLRSEFQRYIGMQNIEKQLNKLAEDPRVQNSIREMNEDLRSGRRELDPMKSYLHNKLIRQLFYRARLKAWAMMKANSEVEALIQADRELKARQNRKLRKTQEAESVLQLQNK